MKYLCLIPDGVADEPQAELGGKTPLEAAEIPNIRSWAATAEVGRVQNVPEGYAPGSDVAIMSILGLDPGIYYTGRAPLEAAAMGIELGDDQVAYRCNLVTVEDGVMRDFSAGHITSDESAPLIESLDEALGGEGISFHPGVGYRHVCVVPRELGDAECVPPHDLSDKPVVLPSGPAAPKLVGLMEASREVLAGHPVNKQRIEEGKLPATQIWLWGQGGRPAVASFRHRYAKDGGIITAVDLVRGLGVLTGLEVIQVPGATGYHDTDYRAKAEYALASLEKKPFCLVHVEATDEAGHEGSLERKMTALENFDHLVAGTIREGLEGEDYRVYLLPDHPTPVSIKTHTSESVPYLLWDSTSPRGGGEYSEPGTEGSRAMVGHEMLGRLLAES